MEAIDAVSRIAYCSDSPLGFLDTPLKNIGKSSGEVREMRDYTETALSTGRLRLMIQRAESEASCPISWKGQAEKGGTGSTPARTE